MLRGERPITRKNFPPVGSFPTASRHGLKSICTSHAEKKRDGINKMVYSLLACGSNGKHQLGTRDHCEDLSLLYKVFESEESIEKLSSGGNHTLLLLTSGELYATGDNSKGQCALSDDVVREFTLVPTMSHSKWVNCCCGYEFSILLNESNELYSCGSGPKGELGLGSGIVNSSGLKLIDTIPGVVEMKACVDHVVIRLSNGKLMAWGNNGRGQKLNVPTLKTIWSPVEVGHADRYSLGRDFTVVENNEALTVWGKQRFPQLPTLVKEFHAMWSSLHYTDQFGCIQSMGNNSHGQLITGRLTPDKWCVGSEHGLIVINGELTAWGWGEHGNCGDHRHGTLTLPQGGGDIYAIHCGCATTWVILKKHS